MKKEFSIFITKPCINSPQAVNHTPSIIKLLYKSFFIIIINGTLSDMYFEIVQISAGAQAAFEYDFCGFLQFKKDVGTLPSNW
jgi:hypothetical protein